MSDERIYGIDLGTTYSCIALVDDYGRPATISNAEGKPTTPSVVYFEGPNQVSVGETAVDAARMFPDRVVTTVKRMMGDEHWRFSCDGMEYTPQQVSAFILRQLAQDAEMQTNVPVQQVVITCPAYFGFNERAATRQAGTIAGLDVKQVIPEPTAAAVAYAKTLDEDQMILVYDLGGGTFDITLLAIEGGTIRTVCIGGYHKLGGTNWDAEVAGYIAQCFGDEHGIPPEELLGRREVYLDFLFRAEKMKKSLTRSNTVNEQVFVDTDVVSVELTREKFEELTHSHLERTLSLTEEVLEDARKHGVNPEDIDRLLLVGGSTFMPQVKRTVEEHFPFKVSHFDPNQSVALGAALIGHEGWALEGEVDGESRGTTDSRGAGQGTEITQKTVVTNVSPRSFGVVVVEPDTFAEKGTNLIVKNAELPATATQIFCTAGEQQTGVKIRCLESRLDNVPGEHFEVNQAEQIGEAELTFTRPLPRGSDVELTFTLSEEGTLSVHGRDLITGSEVEAEFRTASILNPEEEERAKQQALSMKVGQD